jgi:hypothetical protein
MFRLLGAVSAFCIATATLLVGGCSHEAEINSSALPAVPDMRAQLFKQSSSGTPQQSAAGGPFKASYSGSISGSYCYGDIVCTYYGLAGTGHGTFIRASTLSSTDLGCERSLRWYTFFTIRSGKHPTSAIDIKAGGVPKACFPRHKFSGSYTITGGSGKFASASGSGSVTVYVKSWHAFQAHFSGNLTF